MRDTTYVLPGNIHPPVCLRIMDPHSRTANGRIQAIEMRCYHETLRTSHNDRVTNEPGSPCQDLAGNRTTRRPDHRKETQTEVAWTCLPFIRSGQNLLARHSERGKKIRQREEEVRRQNQGVEFAKSLREQKNGGNWL